MAAWLASLAALVKLLTMLFEASQAREERQQGLASALTLSLEEAFNLVKQAHESRETFRRLLAGDPARLRDADDPFRRHD